MSPGTLTPWNSFGTRVGRCTRATGLAVTSAASSTTSSLRSVALLYMNVSSQPAASVEARRAARATAGLREAAAAVATAHKPARELVELLGVPDDQVVLAIHPAARAGVRVLIRGVADVHQLHVLLADLLPGRRVDPRIVDAYLDADPDPDAAAMTARFQLFRPSALRPDGTLPRGFAGSGHWAWGEQSPAALPLENGERVVLLGEPAFAADWDGRRKFPRLHADVERVEALGRAEVERWLAARCPAFRPPVPVRQAA